MQSAIGYGALVHPGAEHRADGAPELLVRVLRERLAQLFQHALLVEHDQLGPVVGGEIRVESIALTLLVQVEQFLEMLMTDAEHHVGIHGDEAPVAVIGETAVAGLCRQRLHGLVVEAEIEHGVHHARHRGAGTGAHGDQERVDLVAELLSGNATDLRQRLLHLRFEVGRVLLVVRGVIGADAGGNGEAGRHRQAEIGHFGKAGALAAQKVAHIGLALGAAVAEGIDPLLLCRNFGPALARLQARFPALILVLILALILGDRLAPGFGLRRLADRLFLGFCADARSFAFGHGSTSTGERWGP